MGLEAGFYRGLSLMFSGDYAHAEQAFADVARVLPLAEVVNNEGVAMSRQGNDGTSLFIQAAAADPNAADYHFNLAVSLKRARKYCGSVERAGAVPEAAPQRQRGAIAGRGVERKAGTDGTGGAASADAGADPLERIVRTFDAAAFRQAAAMLDEMNAGRLAALTPHDRAQALCTQARSYLDRGLLLEAERLYQDAVAADGRARRRMRAWPRCANAAATLMRRARKLRPRWNWALSRCVPGDWRNWICGRRGRSSEADARPAMRSSWSRRIATAQDLMRQIEAKTGR